MPLAAAWFVLTQLPEQTTRGNPRPCKSRPGSICHRQCPQLCWNFDVRTGVPTNYESSNSCGSLATGIFKELMEDPVNTNTARKQPAVIVIRFATVFTLVKPAKRSNNGMQLTSKRHLTVGRLRNPTDTSASFILQIAKFSLVSKSDLECCKKKSTFPPYPLV